MWRFTDREEEEEEEDMEVTGDVGLGVSGFASQEDANCKEFNRLKKEILRSRKAVKVVTGQDAEQVCVGMSLPSTSLY
jgi:pyruvate/2-oxoacid:ferredoxin oxidoreductase alpha subunit